MLFMLTVLKDLKQSKYVIDTDLHIINVMYHAERLQIKLYLYIPFYAHRYLTILDKYKKDETRVILIIITNIHSKQIVFKHF
jgi:hypothetical protein